MSLVTIDPVRLPPAGSWNRHTAHGSPGVGRPGGIARSRPGGSDNLAVVDIETVYNLTSNPTNFANIVNDAWQNNPGKVLKLPPGDFQMTSNVTGGSHILYPAGVILRGSGAGQTRITTGNKFAFGTAGLTGSNHNVTSGPLNKGDTSMTVDGDMSEFYNPYYPPAGALIQIRWQDQIDDAAILAGTIPVFSTEGIPDFRTQTVKVMSVVGSTINFMPPILHQPAPHLWAKCRPIAFSYDADYIGIEDLTIDVNGANPFTVIELGGTYASHLYNVEIKNSNGNYLVTATNCVRLEIRGCAFRENTAGGSNHAGFLAEYCTSMLIEDNVWEYQYPCLEINKSTSGSVYSYNRIMGEFNHNHGPFNTMELVVGNDIDSYYSDGYFGGDDCQTACRNKIRSMAFRRFSFRRNILGNVLNNPGVGNPFWTWTQAQGLAYMSSLWDGTTSSFFAGDFPKDWKQTCTLTTRESDTSGIFTSNGTHRMYEGAFKVLLTHTPTGFYAYNNGAYVELLGTTTVVNLIRSGTVWRWVSGGQVLPPEGTVLNVTGVGVVGYTEHNIDVPNSAFVRGNLSLLTGETGLPAENTIAPGDTLQEFLDETAPAGGSVDEVNWGSCPWYGGGYGHIDRNNPGNAGPRDIPAGRRYEDDLMYSLNVDQTVVATPTFSPAAGSYGSTQSVTISCSTSGATIYYTTNGTNPTTSSSVYSTAISVSSTTTIKAFAVKSGLSDSSVRSGVFTIGAVPAAPTSLSATPVSTTQIDLTWLDESDNETGFKVEQKTGVGGTYSQIATPAANAQSLSVTGLTAATTYYFRLRATNTYGDSTYSNETSATTQSEGGGGGGGGGTTPPLRSARAPQYVIPAS